MRKALNDNPVAQVVVLGALAVIVAFLLITRMQSSSGSSADSTDAGATSTAPATPAPASGATASDVPASPAPPSGAAAAPPVGSPSGAPVGDFVAGPGLPKAVVTAYNDDKAIVLFVFRHRGLDDAPVRASVEKLQGRSDLAVFVTHAANIARYARIATGVDANRVPALIVVRPKHLSDGPPTASISYGFQGADSVDQAVRDALYEGPSNLPYYPR